jgi:predicted negative regulator of RcsB-dependent stress response
MILPPLIISGEIYEKKGEKQKAIEAYQKAIKLDRNDPDPQKALQKLSGK